MSHGSPFRLSLGCSALALATALAATPAQAQSFQGSASVTFGSASITTDTNSTTIQVNSRSAVIDWTPSDNALSANTPINFQPVGTTAQFQNNPQAQTQYSVLNRIVPADASRPVIFNGTVLSRVFEGASLLNGGTVFFYSPGGIVLSPTAVFDVGNLGLTTAPPVVDANGSWYTVSGVQFGQSASNAAVNINAGAQVIAPRQGSFVAAFAPIVGHQGAISVNGRAALVSGEAGTITFSPDGLFDIQVTVGSDGDSNDTGLFTTGSINGGASTGAGDNRRIYLVAIPKNDALFMSIQRGSSIGFDVAGAANVDGNAVILSAGHNITRGAVDTAQAGSANASLIVTDGIGAESGQGIDFTSAVRGEATGNLLVDVFRQTRFASDANLHANGNATVRVNSTNSQGGFQPGGGGIGGGGGNAGNAVVEGFNANMFPPVDDDFRETPLGFSANFFGDTYANTFVSSNGYLTFREGNSSFTPLGLGEGYQGPPIIAAFLADIDTGGAGDNDITYGTGIFNGRPAFGANYPGVGYFNDRTDKLNNFQILLVDRGDTGAGNFDIVYNYNSIQWESGSIESPTDDGFGGNSAAAGYNAGTGNQANTFFVFPGSQVPGSFLDGGPNSLAGQSNVGLSGRYVFNVRGGDVEAGMTRGLLTVGGNLTVSTGQISGAPAGTSRLDVLGGNAVIGGSAQVLAGVNPSVQTNGTVSAGTAQTTVTGGGTLTVGSDLQIDAGVMSRFGSDSQGGTAGLTLDEASTATVGGFTRIIAYGSSGGTNGATGQGGSGQGGDSSLAVHGGSRLVTNLLNIAADGVGSAAAVSDGGNGTGGTATIEVSGAGSVIEVAVSDLMQEVPLFAQEALSADGVGGGAFGGGATGGTGTGGMASISVTDGAVLSLPTAEGSRSLIVARGYGGFVTGNEGTGGTGTGGMVSIAVDTAALIGEALQPSSFGQGGSFGEETTLLINGGDGVGGTRALSFTNGASFTGSIPYGCACGIGGSGIGGGRGGNASGGVGTTLFDASTANLSLLGLVTFTQSTGGTGASDGNAVGGTASMTFRNGSSVVLADGSELRSDARSYTSVEGTSPGGNASGGSATLSIENSSVTGNGTIDVLAGVFTLRPDLEIRTGGTALFQTSGASTVDVSALIVDSIGDGATGGSGGSATALLGGGTLSADTIRLISAANGGANVLRLTNTAATAGSVSVTQSATALLDLDNSTLTTDSFALDAGTMILPATPPASSGTVTAPSLSLSVGEGGSIRTYASFVTTEDLVFATPEIVLGSLTTDGLVNLRALSGPLTVGNINATQARLTATGNVQAGVATLGTQQSRGFLEATSANGSVSLGGATAGEVVLSGPVGVSAGAITASNIYAVTGGNLTVSGAWRAQSIRGSSSDIAITSNGAMFAQESIELFSTSTTQTIVGDAQGGSWVLDNAEFSRLHAPEINIYANDEGSDPIALLIGDLTVRGAQSGESANLTTEDGELSFFISSRDEETNFVGTAKVVGSLRGTGFTAENTIDFDADVFQLDAVNGIAELLDSNGNISGVLELEANRIWVASPEILSRLEADPMYEGRINDINTPLAVPRPDGVVRAGFVNIEERPPVQVLVQNTGTRALPAGFFSGSTGPFGEDFEGEVIAGAIELAINGQLVVDGQVITGQAVVNQLISEENRVAFSEISTINSCTAAGACPNQGDAFASTIASEFALLTDLQLSEEPFAVEDATEEEENEAEQAARAPIAPPVILIDTRPLNPPLDIVDPVSGSGNPALVNPATPAGSQGDGQ